MATTTPAPEAETGNGKKKIVLLALVMALVAAGFWFAFMRPADAAKTPEPGEVMMLEPVHVNLAGGAYLKVAVALQMSADAGGHGEPNGAAALDLVISEFSQANPAAVATKRAEFKKSLEKKVIKEYHGDVLKIYFTEYVTQ